MSLPKTIYYCTEHGEPGSEMWCPGGPVAKVVDGAPCSFVELRVAGRDDLLIRREDIDYEAAARLFHKQIPHGPWNPTLDQCTCRARARGIVDAALAATEGETP